MKFEFATAGKIIFGNGVIKEIPSLAFKMGRRVLLVTGGNIKRSEPLISSLIDEGLEVVPFSVSGEPTIQVISDGTELALKTKTDLVMGMGGGSVMDSAKAVSALLTNPGSIMDYLEVIGKGKPLTHPSAPCITIPTTAGTGAEVTKNAVIISTEHAVKVSLRSPAMYPTLAVVDPELTYSMPPSLTASTGLDALTQLLESFVSVKSNPLTDTLCKEGLMRAARSIGKAYTNGTDISAREDMAIASLFGGLTLANSGLGAVHGIAGPLRGMFPVPHGVVCGKLLPFVMDMNIRILQRDRTRFFLSRYDYVAQILTGDLKAKAGDGVAWIHNLCASLRMPNLSNFGITQNAFQDIVSRSKMASSMKGNPVSLTEEDVLEILQKAISL